MSDDLKPCPFCGHSEINISKRGSDERSGYCGSCIVDCLSCGASVTRYDIPNKNGWCVGPQDTKDRAIAAWNTRAKADALCRRVAELEAALEIIAGRRQCMDNMMGNRDVAIWVLDRGIKTDE